MSCLDNTGLLRFLDGSMAAEDLGVIEEHLDHCELCRGLVATLVQVRSAAASQPPPTERASRALTAMDEQADGEGRCHMRRYVLLRLLGQGGMGQVFRAKDRQSGQIVALKRVSQHTAALNRGELAALSEEFRILSSLRHPCIISVLDYGFDSRQRPYFTMEFLEGACPVLPVAATAPRDVQVALLCQILQALGYLHRRRVLHRDLKPSNILLVPSKSGPTVKIVDFGLSLTAASPSRDHAVGTVKKERA